MGGRHLPTLQRATSTMMQHATSTLQRATSGHRTTGSIGTNSSFAKKSGHATEANRLTSRFEKVWLFHGTDEETVPKIITGGFNRSFCGKNATAYGKGVYFARDAAYSSSTTYSVPDSSGVQHMFACRVTVGEYCIGHHDQLVPDVRVGNVLYDTTVDKLDNPTLYVTYHDAQAYPDYIVHFKQ